MVQVTMELDTSKLTDKLGKVKEVQRLGLDYATQGMVSTLMQNSPVKHGLLKSWFVESITDDEAHIKTPAAYAQYVNDGTAPYIITPSSKQALFWEGADHPVKLVHHPGITGQHFVENSIDQIEPQLQGFFLKALYEVIG